MKHKIAGLVVFLVVGCTLTAAGARNEYLAIGKGSDQPITVTSEKFTAKNIPNGKEAAFDGNVRVKQGDVTLTCDRLVIAYDEKTGAGTGEGKVKKFHRGLDNINQMKSITASGNVKIVQNQRMALSGKALYDNMGRTITLTENPRLWQGADMLVANTITIYLDENRIVTEGDKNPINFTINPGQQKEEKEK
jgi:lipopolysaccharide export system protein LptA